MKYQLFETCQNKSSVIYIEISTTPELGKYDTIKNKKSFIFDNKEKCPKRKKYEAYQ